MPDKTDLSFRRLILFLFKDIFSILFYYFKVLDIILGRVCHCLLVMENGPENLEEVSYV
jgi:hypothetical protein